MVYTYSIQTNTETHEMNATELKAKIEKVMEVTGKTYKEITDLLTAKDNWTWTLVNNANV